MELLLIVFGMCMGVLLTYIKIVLPMSKEIEVLINKTQGFSNEQQ